MDDYSYGRDIKLQLTNVVGCVVRFSIVSYPLKNNSSDKFLEIRLWWRPLHQHRLEYLGIFLNFIPPPSSGPTPDVLRRGSSVMDLSTIM